MQWPFRRTIHERVTKVENRLQTVEERQKQEKEDVQQVKDRLTLLEVQASTIARQHLTRRQKPRDEVKEPT